MAIQLSERDNLIFKFINEHHVLLEKHIAWFISCDEKPVLIRDRLRKLFYLDYLLCQRHGGKLPWWTTPTKPLVYMLSPMSRQIIKTQDEDIDRTNAEVQRHLLEVANLRMLFLVDQQESVISDFQWTTLVQPQTVHESMDALVSFKRDGRTVRVGIINHPLKTGAEPQSMMQHAAADKNVDVIWVVSRDEAHQAMLQKELINASFASKLAFTTHQEVYKAGMVKAKWQSTQPVPSADAGERLPWNAGLTPLPAC